MTLCDSYKMTTKILNLYHIGGVMVSVLTWSAVDHGFKNASGHTKDYNIGICCFSGKNTALRSNLVVRIMCQSEAPCLPADCCFSEHYKRPT